MEVSGWIILDKPSGMTSRRAGAICARMIGAKTFGHVGTLDPMASGLLPIAFGQASKMIPYLEEIAVKNSYFNAARKEYEFGVQFGFETDTLDITGKEIKRDDRLPDYRLVDWVCDCVGGEFQQVPPAYSAIHINGKRSYELARRGVAVEMKPRKIHISSLILGKMNIGYNDKMISGVFKVVCSAGTYVRSLARDIGVLVGVENSVAPYKFKSPMVLNKNWRYARFVHQLRRILSAKYRREHSGTPYLATVDYIRRTQTHGFDIKDAVKLDFLENLYNNNPSLVLEYLKPVDFGLDDILVARLDDNDAKLFQNGGFIYVCDMKHVACDMNLRRVYSDSRCMGIGIVEDGLLKPKRVLN